MEFKNEKFKIVMTIFGEPVAEVCMLSKRVKYLKEIEPSKKSGIRFLLLNKLREV